MVRWILALLWVLVLTVLLNTVTGFWALKRLERKAGTPIRGTFLPDFLKPSFTLKNAHLSWQNRFEVLSGTVRVRYSPVTVLVGKKFRIQLEGTGLRVRLLQESAFAGIPHSEIQADHVTADFALSNHKTPEIYGLDIHSPELEFHFAEKDRNWVKRGAPATEN